MMNKISYVNFNEAGLKPIIDGLRRRKQKVVSVKATNIPKREDGFLVKTAMLAFESGQKLEIKIKANGSIFQVRLNGKVVPVKNSDDLQEPRNLAAAIKEMAGYIDRNEAIYQKRQEAAAKRVVKKKDRAATSAKKRLEMMQSSFEEMTETGKGLEQDLAEAKGEADKKGGELASLNAELEKELSRNEALSAELNELLEAA